MSEKYVCWPCPWQEAAIAAGLAVRTEYGANFGSDELRDKLEIFAARLLEEYEDLPGTDEYSERENAEAQDEEDRYNDPRTGQAAGLNRENRGRE